MCDDSLLQGRPDGPRSVVCVVSTMRAGSTLLKALLGAADDVSHLKEVNFHRIAAEDDVQALSDKPVVVLKRPAWFHDLHVYPRIPNIPGIKTIVLYRNAYDTVRSLKRMLFGSFKRLAGRRVDRLLVNWYWYTAHDNMLSRTTNDDHTVYVDYSDLIDSPKAVTARLFEFVGSATTEGVDSYGEPEKGGWKHWGNDDAGPKIRTKTVQRYSRGTEDPVLRQVVDESEKVREILDRYEPLLLKI